VPFGQASDGQQVSCFLRAIVGSAKFHCGAPRLTKSISGAPSLMPSLAEASDANAIVPTMVAVTAAAVSPILLIFPTITFPPSWCVVLDLNPPSPGSCRYHNGFGVACDPPPSTFDLRRDPPQNLSVVKAARVHVLSKHV